MKPMAWVVGPGETLESTRAKCPHRTLVADADYSPMRNYCGDCGQDLGDDMKPIVIKPAGTTKDGRRLEPPPPDGFDQESVYDKKINPLMAKIIGICKEARISVNATFFMDGPDEDCEDGIMVKTHIPRLDREESEPMKILRRAQAESSSNR